MLLLQVYLHLPVLQVPAGGNCLQQGRGVQGSYLLCSTSSRPPLPLSGWSNAHGQDPLLSIACARTNYVARLHGGGRTEAIELNHALLLLRKGRPYAWLASRVQGIEHLSNLKKVFICLGYSRSRGKESQLPTIEAAIRSFFDEHHPGAPTIHVTSYPYLYDD